MYVLKHPALSTPCSILALPPPPGRAGGQVGIGDLIEDKAVTKFYRKACMVVASDKVK